MSTALKSSENWSGRSARFKVGQPLAGRGASVQTGPGFILVALEDRAPYHSRKRDLLLATTSGVHIDRQRLDRQRIKTGFPAGHDTGTTIGDRFDDGLAIATIEPDGIGQVW